VQPERGVWWCRGCSGERWGDAIGYVQKRDGLSFIEACRQLGASPSELGETVARRRAPAPGEELEPSPTWRQAGLVFVERSEAARSEAGADARAYLHGRGLQAETLRHWRVGLACTCPRVRS
jgi:DNA primase